jgi:hypothetical protein
VLRSGRVDSRVRVSGAVVLRVAAAARRIIFPRAQSPLGVVSGGVGELGGVVPRHGRRGGGGDHAMGFCLPASAPSRRSLLRLRREACGVSVGCSLAAGVRCLGWRRWIAGGDDDPGAGLVERRRQIECSSPTWSERRNRSGNRDPARGRSPVDVPQRRRARRVRRPSPSTRKASDGDGAASAPATKDVCVCRPPRPFFVILFLLGVFSAVSPGCVLSPGFSGSFCFGVVLRWFV